jgi:hypothetical protein
MVIDSGAGSTVASSPSHSLRTLVKPWMTARICWASLRGSSLLVLVVLVDEEPLEKAAANDLGDLASQVPARRRVQRQREPSRVGELQCVSNVATDLGLVHFHFVQVDKRVHAADTCWTSGLPARRRPSQERQSPLEAWRFCGGSFLFVPQPWQQSKFFDQRSGASRPEDGAMGRIPTFRMASVGSAICTCCGMDCRARIARASSARRVFKAASCWSMASISRVNPAISALV